MSTASSNKVLYFQTVLSRCFYIECENLLYLAIRPEPQPELEVVISNFEETYRVLGERQVKVTIDTRHLEFLKVPREVMDYMSNNPYLKYQESNALLMNGLAQKILGNFYLNIMRPPVKTRLFTEQDSMLSWHQIQDTALVNAAIGRLLTSIS